MTGQWGQLASVLTNVSDWILFMKVYDEYYKTMGPIGVIFNHRFRQKLGSYLTNVSDQKSFIKVYHEYD